MALYKFLNLKGGKIVSAYDNSPWTIGKTRTVKGSVIACENGFHASKQPLEALNYVGGSVIAIVEGSGAFDDQGDKFAYESMTLLRAYKWTQEMSVKFAIYAAEQVIKIYEDKYPNDSRPRDAIKAARAYLKDPSKKSQDAARAAARAAGDAANAARAAAYAARAAARAAADAAYAAAYAAYAARAAYAAMKAKLNRWIKSHIKDLEEIK